MSDQIHDVPADGQRAHVDAAKYRDMYAHSIKDRTGSGRRKQAAALVQNADKIKNTNFGPGNVSIKWFEDGETNVSYNCIGPATLAGAPTRSRSSGRRRPCRIQAHHLSATARRDVPDGQHPAQPQWSRGDRVTIYMPDDPGKPPTRMLACAAHRAIHSWCSRLSPDSLAGRIEDCGSKVIITADEGLRGGRKVPLKANVDAAIAKCGGVDHVIVVKRTRHKVEMDPVRDVYYHDAAAVVTDECPPRT